MKAVFLYSCLLLSLSMRAQMIDFTVPVSLQYEGEPLANVLDDISRRYGVGFSYSRQIIPIHQDIYCNVEDKPFGEAMDILFAQTQVIYGVIGDQIVLSIDMYKVPVKPGRKIEHDDSIVSVTYVPRATYLIPSLDTKYTVIEYQTTRIVVKDVEYDLSQRITRIEKEESAFRVQVTVVPPLQADTDAGSEKPVNLSFNMLAGITDKVQGLEMGGLVNVVRQDMDGVQTSGLVNLVGNRFEGVQAAGLVNASKKAGYGIQAAGLVNALDSGEVFQAAGLANVAHRQVHTQASGLINVAGDVHGAQVAGLVNVAKHVRGVQIGLFNFADSVGGVPVGLISFVRKRGYHSFEVAGQDAIDFNFNLRLGVRGFYNILHAGIDNGGENWSLGYGLGTSFHLSRRNFLQLEVLARQVNEDDTWTEHLNLANQLNLIYDFALGKNLRLAIGPTFNVAVSQRYNADTDTYGTDVPRYVIYEHTHDDGYHLPVNVKYWAGLHVGIRFGTADWFPDDAGTY